MTTREENRIRIVREIPLWGVITGLIAVLMMAGAAAYNQVSGQQRLLELMTAQGTAIQELTIKVTQLSIQINGKDLKDVEHECCHRSVAQAVHMTAAQQRAEIS